MVKAGMLRQILVRLIYPSLFTLPPGVIGRLCSKQEC